MKETIEEMIPGGKIFCVFQGCNKLPTMQCIAPKGVAIVSVHLTSGNPQNLQRIRNESLTREIYIISSYTSALVKPKQVISRDLQTQQD